MCSIIILFSAFLFCSNAFSQSMGNWYERDPGANESVMGIAYGNGTWVIVGTHGYIASSTDGKVWKKHSAGIDRQFNEVTFQRGRFIAVCKAPDEGSGAKIWISDNNGKSWKYRDSDSGGDYLTEGLHSVAGNGNGLLVAVGGGWFGKMTISGDNGNTWNVKNIEGVSSLHGVVYGNGVWIACGKGEPIRSFDNGVTWQKITDGPIGTSVAYGNGIFVISTMDGMSWSKDNGSTWEKCVKAEEYDSYIFGRGRGVTFANGYFAAVFENNGIWMSDTGITWKKWLAPGNNPFYYCITYGARTFMAGGDQSVGSEYPAILAESPPWFRAKMGTPNDFPFTVFDKEDSLPKKIGLPEYRVNTSSLNLVLEGTLFYMKTLGVPVNMKLVYCSSPLKNGDASIGLFGKNWHLIYESWIGQFGNEAQMASPGGRLLTFSTPKGEDLDTATQQNPITLLAPAGIFGTLKFYGPGEHFEYFEKNTKLTYKYAVGIDYIWHLTSITDRNGNKLTVNVDKTEGHITSIHDPSGRTVTFSYDDQKKLCTGFTVPDGRSVSFTYDDDKNLTQIRDMAGYLGKYNYDELGFMTGMSTGGRKTDFTFEKRPGYNEDEEGLKNQEGAGDKIVATVTNYLGKTTKYEILENSNSVQRTDPLGNKTVFDSDDGQTTTVKDPLGELRSIEYGGLKLPTRFTDSNGKSSEIEYDSSGNMTSFKDMLGNTSSYTYDSKDNMLSRTDALGKTTTFKYNSNSLMTSSTTPLGYVTKMDYLANGKLHTLTDAGGNSTSFTYDGFGNTTAIVDALSGTISFLYDPNGLRCKSITDQRNKIKSMTYDNNDRLLALVYDSVAGTPAIKNVFDAHGQIEFINELNKTTRVRRNDFGFITSLTDPLGFSQTMEYDPNNNQIRQVDTLGALVTQTFDENNRPLITTDSLGKEISRKYDTNGNLISISHNKKTTLFTYDANDALIKTTDPLGRNISVVRDKLGRIETTTNARGNKIKNTYDADSRLIKKEYDSGSGFSTEAEFEYNPLGSFTSMKDRWGTTSLTYDEMNRVKSMTYPDSSSVSFTYDAAGNVKTISYPGAIVATYEYDDYNRQIVPLNFRNSPGAEIYGGQEKPNLPVSISMTSGGLPLGTITFKYDLAANLDKITLPNGVTTEYVYDSNQRVTSIIHKNSGGAILEYAYSFDSAGNVVGESASGAAVISPPLPDSTKISYNAVGEVVKEGKNAFVYDADGNLTNIESAGFTAAYNAENRPLSITRKINGVSVKTDYTYNGTGLLVKKTIDGSNIQYYHYDNAGKLLFISNGGGAVTKSLIYADGRIVAFVSQHDGNSLSFPHCGINGNIAAISDGSGNIVAKYGYMPYGQLSSETSISNPFTFVGSFGVIDEGAGLYYMKNRFYDATTGRFLQRDPIGFSAGINLYAYAGANPFNQIDPQGLKVGWSKIGTGFTNLTVGVGSTLLGGALVAESFCNPTTAPLIPVKIVSAKTLLVVGATRLFGGLKQVYEGLSGQKHESTFDTVADLPLFDPSGLARKVGSAIGNQFNPDTQLNYRKQALSEEMNKMRERMESGDPEAFDQWLSMGEELQKLDQEGDKQ